MPHQSRPDLVEKAIAAIPRPQIQWNNAAFKKMRSDPELKGFTDVAVKQLLWDAICTRGLKCRARAETDEDWLDKHLDDPWWYFLVIPVPEFPKGLFVKMKLLWEEGDLESDAFVEIINVHEEK